MSRPGGVLARLGHASRVLLGRASVADWQRPEGWTITNGRHIAEIEYKGRAVRQAWERHPVVQACARLVADHLAAVPLEVYTEGPDGDEALPQDLETGVLPGVMTDEEEEALRLVEQILEEQQMILVGQNFVYRAEGRRDPFRNILQLRRRELVAPTQRPPGLEGFLINEIDVTATARSQGRWHVLVVGLDQRTYTATVGTQLYDGRIVSISLNEVVFEQEVEDLLGARSTRQVVRKLNEDQD